MPYRPAQLKALLSARNPHFTAKQLPSLAARVAHTDVWLRMFRLEDRAVRDLAAAYTSAFETLRTASDGLPDTLTPAARDRLYAQVDATGTRLTNAAAALGLRYASTALRAGYYGRLYALDMQTRADVDIAAPAIDPLQSLLREDAYDDVIRSLLGREWRLKYALEIEQLAAQIKQQISIGMSEGEGISAIMRRVRGVMGVPTDRRQGYRANFNRVQTLVRTLVNQASNTGAWHAYRANADVLGGYQWVAARDERVCPTCRGLDGTTYRLNDSYRPPAHPNCRCAVVAVVRPDWAADDDEPPRENLDEWLVNYGLAVALMDFLLPRLETERV